MALINGVGAVVFPQWYFIIRIANFGIAGWCLKILISQSSDDIIVESCRERSQGVHIQNRP